MITDYRLSALALLVFASVAAAQTPLPKPQNTKFVPEVHYSLRRGFIIAPTTGNQNGVITPYRLWENEWKDLPLRLAFEREMIRNIDPNDRSNSVYQVGTMRLRLRLGGGWSLTPKYRAPTDRRPGMIELRLRLRF